MFYRIILASLLATSAVSSLSAQEKQADGAKPANDFGTSPVWQRDGQYATVAVHNQTKSIYAATARGNVVSFDESGKPTDWTVKGAGDRLVLANLVAGDEPEVITFSPWGKSVDAVNRVGQSLWKDVIGQGIDDVWAADLTGNGADEVIIGYNGNTGLHVLDRRGRLKWMNTEIGNVWHVCAGNVDDDDDIEVVTTSAQGQVHIFSSDGTNERNLDVPLYANMVRIAPTKPTKANPAPNTILAGGSADNGEAIVAITGNGDIRYTLKLPGAKRGHIDSMTVCSSPPWAAVGMRDGVVHVFNSDDGKIIATVSGQGKMPNVDWLQRENESPLLIAATGAAINAFEIDSK